MIVGMDFGTTNSGMAVFDGETVNVLPLDPTNRNPRVARTALYLSNDRRVFIGREAIDTYFDQNVGRPVKMERVWVGEIEVTMADMSFIRDVYIWVDALSPGRLFLSIKTSLADTDYLGTVIDPYFYALEDLIAIYLMITRDRAQQLLGQPLRKVVLGRPVRFSTDPEKDAVAQQRLVEAATRAGYEEVYFQYEPIAAALHYENEMHKAQNVLIFDFGGGTLDLTIMRLGDYKSRKVLATGGVPIAGDIFDQKLIRAKLPQHFGAGTEYGSRGKPLKMPAWIHNTFANWQTILQLQTPANVETLQQIARTSHDPKGVRALINMVSGNYGLHMFDIVERSKQRLSRRQATIIPLSGPGFNIRQSVTRSEFEAIINQETRKIEETLNETLAASGLRADQIDMVIRTGGSSQIPVFEQMLEQKFGADKVQASNIFSSVTSGLGITAHGIEQGEIESQVYRSNGRGLLNMGAQQSRVNPVNLDLLKKRLGLDEANAGTVVDRSSTVLATVNGQSEPSVVTLPDLADQITIPLPDVDETLQPVRVMPAAEDEPLLWLTSNYRFILMSAREVQNMQDTDLELAELQRFEEWEIISTVSQWTDIKQQSNMVVVTSEGIARRFTTAMMRPRIEGPTGLQLDRALAGIPVAVLGLPEENELLLYTQNGRLARVDSQKLSVQGSQVLARQKNDEVIGALLVRPDDELLVTAADGYARRVRVDWLPPAEAKGRAMSMITRRPIINVSVICAERQLWAATSRQFVRLDTDLAPLGEAASKKAIRLLKLSKGETVRDIFALVKPEKPD